MGGKARIEFEVCFFIFYIRLNFRFNFFILLISNDLFKMKKKVLYHETYMRTLHCMHYAFFKALY